MATLWTLGGDAADPQRIAAFWALALGYVTEPGFDEPGVASIVDPDGRGPAIGFLKVPEGKTAKNRLHIDLAPDDRDAEVDRLLTLGATRADVGQGDDVSWVVLADPEGNEFCLLSRTVQEVRGGPGG